ncbi:MAG: hypothetical protein JNK41_00410 [Saprospiraceae bacterium]|nr:hypothetical protein [Saprospiraceae bacterium]
MNRIILALLIGVLSITSYAQSDCPPEYELRSVECDGKISSQCIPENYTCKSCWIMEYAYRNTGSFENSAYGHTGGSYAECEQIHAKDIEEDSHRNPNNHPAFDPSIYRIYLSSSKFCKSRSASEELSLKINSLIDDWEHDVRDAIRECMGYENIPNILPIVTEWAGNNQKAMRNLQRLREETNRYTNMALSFLEKKFDEATKNVEDFRITNSGYRNQANSEKNAEKVKQEKLKQEKLKQEQIQKDKLEKEKQVQTQKRIENENSIKNQLAKEKQKKDELLNNNRSSRVNTNNEKSNTLLSVQANVNSIQSVLAAERQKKKEALSKADIKQQVQKSTNNLTNEKQNAIKNEKGTQEKWVFMCTAYFGGMNYISDVVSLNELGCIGSSSEYNCAEKWFLNKVLSSMKNVRDGGDLIVYVGTINTGVPWYSTDKMEMIQMRAKVIKGYNLEYAQYTEVH